ncbi:MAG: mono/diheme cytochrome c family protein, partial [Saprospiraceae bacterium]
DEELYTVMHGRDDLLRLFPEYFSPWHSALLPSEEFLKITENSNFGWPYCFYDQLEERKVLAPEYGGDGEIIGRCSQFDDPIMGFPGHWAPNDLLFYSGDQFPERYKGGAFIAFHGSTNRAPYPQSGYIVGFIPFVDGKPNCQLEVFADGFARVDTIVDVNDAVFRPMGLAQGPDGSLYIGDTEHGAIWRVQFRGDKDNFGDIQLAKMEDRKNLIHLRTPHKINDNLQKDSKFQGAFTYTTYCATCHQSNGKGDSGRFPPLNRTPWVTGDKERLINLVLNGLEGSINVKGEIYNNTMPQHSFLNDEKVADVLTYIRKSFGNRASEITEEEVRNIRAKSKDLEM